jgi:hypothetical protein
MPSPHQGFAPEVRGLNPKPHAAHVGTQQQSNTRPVDGLDAVPYAEGTDAWAVQQQQQQYISNTTIDQQYKSSIKQYMSSTSVVQKR